LVLVVVLTGDPEVLVLVKHKLDMVELGLGDIVATRLANFKTDVLEVGYPIAEQIQTPPVVEANGAVTLAEEQYVALADALMLAKRTRPAKGGYSVGHYGITAGTIGTSVYDILPGGSTSGSPAIGVGMPPRYYILSNNHVLANVNDAKIGDPILQPGPYDGGTDPADRIATLIGASARALTRSAAGLQHHGVGVGARVPCGCRCDDAFV
jgi:hypothetical protein